MVRISLSCNCWHANTLTPYQQSPRFHSLFIIFFAVGTSLLWTINTTLSGAVPFSMGLCDGQLRVLTPFYWRNAKSYMVALTVTNDGTSLGIGSSRSTCVTWVNVSMVPIPPVASVTSFTLPELTNVGTLVGNVMASDPNNFTFNCTWDTIDTPNAFSVSRDCNISVLLSQDTLLTLKSVYSYVLNITNGYATARVPITITLTPIPRPPVTFAQSSSIIDNAPKFTQLSPSLIASQPQGLPYTFSITPTNVFNVTSNGTVYLNAANTLDYSVQSSYTLSFIVTASNSLTATANLVITIIQSNKAPVFVNSRVFNFTVNEGSSVGTALTGSPAIRATDVNAQDVLSYRIVSSLPASGSQAFTLDSSSGVLTLGAGLAATAGKLVFNETLSYPAANTYKLNVSATDSGSPTLSDNAVVWVTVSNIMPRVAFTTNNTGVYWIQQNWSIGAVVTDFGSLAWTAYNRALLTYTMSAETCATGDTAFVIDPTSGIVKIANVSYFSLALNRTIFSAPRFDYNTKSQFKVNVTVTDGTTSLFLTSYLTVNLNHINRAPVWLTVPQLFAATLHSANIGNPLSVYVNDPDTTISSVHEAFIFTIVSGNVDSTFGIDSSTGQLYVAVNNTPSFDLTNPSSVPIYNLTINVRDAGIDGPVYNASALVQIKITASNLPPSIGFYNLSISQLVPVGTLVGYVNGTSPKTVARLTYTMSPTGPNINQPFPFNISTMPGGISNYNTGKIYVIDDGPVDWTYGFKVYYATVTVTDDDPVSPLSASAPLQINVNWTPTAPFFNPSRAPNSWTFTISVLEHAPPGANVSSTGLLASSRDSGMIPLLRYKWQNPGALASVFAVDSITGMVTMAPSAPTLQFNTQQQYTMKLYVNDTRNMNDTATVIINIIEVNSPAAFTSLGDAVNATLPLSASLTVAENATVGTVFGYVRAADPNALSPNGPSLWSQMIFKLVASSDSVFFNIDSRSGALSIAQTGLNYWDQTRFMLNVSVEDASATPIVVTRTVWVNLTQINTVRVTGFAVATGTNAALGVNVSSSSFAGSYTNVDVLYATRGMSTLLIIGSGFGRTARRLTAEGLTPSASTITATFGFTGTGYTATCTVLTPNTVLACSVPAGFGFGFIWKITVDGWAVTTTVRTGYLPPNVDTVIKLGGSMGVPSSNILHTTGVDSVDVYGDNFGAVGSSVVLSYGTVPSASLTYVSPSCVVQAPGHTRMICTTLQGVGANFGFRVTIGSQSSATFTNTSVRYEAPAITTVSNNLLNTAGNEVDAIVVNGTGFGPAGTTGIVVTYSKDITFNGSTYPIFTASNCYVSPANPHTMLLCTSAPGIGAGLAVNVVVGGQSSGASPVAQVLHYKVPVITDIGGLGSARALTIGGQQVVLSGSQFGLLTPLSGNGNPVAGALQPIAKYGHVGSSPLTYTAAECRVSVANSQIICLTVEGTGKDLVWQVTVGEQASVIFTDKTTSYAAPIVASYAGDGAADAFTWGDQVVHISGTNFGPMGTVVSQATYSSGVNSTVFTAYNCTLVVAHTMVDCMTTVGAGAGLSWILVIDEQQSVSPTTAYGAPVIYNFSGPGAMDASTDGGDLVIITGSFFSIDQFLESVTYGPTGAEFKAVNYHLLEPHKQIACYTAPGAGRALQWLITVGGQVNAMSGLITSYAPPQIFSVTPDHAPTDGGTVITILGSDFALNYSSAQVVVKINNYMLAQPADDVLQAHWDAIYSGQPGVPAVDTWIASLATQRPLTSTIIRRGLHSITVALPSGFGSSCSLFVMVNGVPSNISTFMYDPPVITNVAPDHQGVPPGNLRVFLEGKSFCGGELGCGSVSVNNVTIPANQWSDSLIMFITPDTSMTDEINYVVVTVGGVASNAYGFQKAVPNINSQITQLSWTSMDTNGNQSFSVYGVHDIGSTCRIFIGRAECMDVTQTVTNGLTTFDPDAEFALSCSTPPGVGTLLPITIQGAGGTSRADSSFTFSYAAPVLSDMTMDVGGRRLGRADNMHNRQLITASAVIPTVGGNATIAGMYFGTPELQAFFGDGSKLTLDNMVQLPVFTYAQTAISTAIPPGDGLNHAVSFYAGDQLSAALIIHYAGPTVNGISPSHGPTAGGTVVTITGSNFGISMPTVTIGGLPCAVVTPYVPLANHTQIRCVVAAGQGASLKVVVTINGQQSSSTVLYSYDPPQVTSITPDHGPTSGLARGPLTADGVHRSNGNKIMQMLTGINFGTSGYISYAPQDSSDYLTSNATVPAANIISWNDTSIVYYMPEGYGYSLFVSVFVGQPSTRGVTFSYDPPAVLAVTRYDLAVDQCRVFHQCFHFGNITRCRDVPAGCYDTIGGYLLELVGESFGDQSALFAFTNVHVGTGACTFSTDMAVRSVMSHTRLVCIVPSGLGENLPVTVSLGGRTSLVSAQSLFSYDPPVVSGISPNTPDAMGTQSVTIRGKNFGVTKTDLFITINDVACYDQQWLNDGLLSCHTPAEIVGAKNVSILVANRTTPYTYYDVEEALVYECAPSFYGLDGEVCLPCMQGGKCPGSERFIDMVNATAGFWRINASVDSVQAQQFCDAPRRLTREACPAMLVCGPPDACLANNICADGYEGEACAYCLKGTYYRVNGDCVKCPNNLYVLYVGLVLLLLCMIAFSYFLNKKNVSLALIAIGVDYAQVMSMFARANIVWPPVLVQMFRILSAFNLNIDITAPECLNPGIQYWQTWFFIESKYSSRFATSCTPCSCHSLCCLQASPSACY
jgi:hypothetical protein